MQFYLFSFFFKCSRAPRFLHSFPTRRSSDLLGAVAVAGGQPIGPHDRPGRRARLPGDRRGGLDRVDPLDRKSTRLNSSHTVISYAVFCLKKKKQKKKKRHHT